MDSIDPKKTEISPRERHSASRRRTVSAVLASVSAILVGCVPGTAPQGPRPPEQNEKEIFATISDFYCRTSRWPQRWEEIVAARSVKDVSAGVSAPSLLDDFHEVRLSSSRAITLTMEYKTVGGAPRKVTFISPPLCTGEPVPGVISIAGGRVAFRLSPEFKLLDVAAVRERWKSGPYPDVAWEKPESGIVVAVRFGEADVSVEGLSELKTALERSFQLTVAGLKWISRRNERDAKVPHLLHEFESDSLKGRLVTIATSMSFDAKLLSINVVGPVAGRSEVEAVAEAVLASLSLS